MVWRGIVYVFGSYVGEAGDKCECVRVDGEGKWKRIPSMQAMRALFTPVLWRQAIYLCGGT